MIRLRIKIKSLNGETYTNDEEKTDDFMVARENPEFQRIIDQNIAQSAIKEIDGVTVTAYFGEI